MLVSKAEWSFVSLANAKFAFVILFYISAFVLSGYIMLQTKFKFVVAGILFFAGVLCSAIMNLPNDLKTFSLSCCQNSYSYVVEYNGDAIVVSNVFDENLSTFLAKRGITKVDYVFFQKTIDQSVAIKQKYQGTQYICLENLQDYSYQYLEKISYRPIAPTGEIMGLEIVFGDESMVFLFDDDLSSKDVFNLQYELDFLNVMVVAGFGEQDDLYFELTNSEQIVFVDKVFNKNDEIEIENWTTTIKNGMLENIRSLD